MGADQDAIVVDKILDPARLGHARANGTATALEACARVNVGLPHVIVGATPPDLLVRAKSDVGRRQVTVERLIPFARKRGLERFQVVKARC